MFFAIYEKLFQTTLVGVISSVGTLCPNFQQFPSNITPKFYITCKLLRFQTADTPPVLLGAARYSAALWVTWGGP